MSNQTKLNKTVQPKINESQNKKQDIWSDMFANPSQPKKVNESAPKLSTQNFDAFKDVFTNTTVGKQAYKSSGLGQSSSNTSNFHEFFEEIGTNENKSKEGQKQKQAPKVETNLLDL